MRAAACVAVTNGAGFVMSAMATANSAEPERSPEYVKGYDAGYQDGFRDGNEQAFDRDYCEQCNDYH